MSDKAREFLGNYFRAPLHSMLIIPTLFVIPLSIAGKPLDLSSPSFLVLSGIAWIILIIFLTIAHFYICFIIWERYLWFQEALVATGLTFIITYSLSGLATYFWGQHTPLDVVITVTVTIVVLLTVLPPLIYLLLIGLLSFFSPDSKKSHVPDNKAKATTQHDHDHYPETFK